jgi:hypothetical protein
MSGRQWMNVAWLLLIFAVLNLIFLFTELSVNLFHSAS